MKRGNFIGIVWLSVTNNTSVLRYLHTYLQLKDVVSNISKFHVLRIRSIVEEFQEIVATFSKVSGISIIDLLVMGDTKNRLIVVVLFAKS